MNEEAHPGGMHEPVLLGEVVDLLHIRPEGLYVDGTLGLGGHAEAIVSRLSGQGKLLGLDVDPTNLVRAESRLQPFGNRTTTRRANFRGLQGVLRGLGWNAVDGMLFDLGVSSPHLDEAERGFSFQKCGPLDMRMDPQGKKTALSLLREMSEDDLIKVLIEFGEGRFARKLSRAILHDVRQDLIKTTRDLADLCQRIVRKRGKTHGATRVFLALRNLVNDELGALQELLNTAPPLLSVGGRMGIIAFHSLEDRLVKVTFKTLEQEGLMGMAFRRVTKKPVQASQTETDRNPRARSAKLRVLERLR